MGPRGGFRRGRRRGLIVGAAVGSAAARRGARSSEPEQHNGEGNEDQLAELEKLGELKERGILTEDEFQAKKKQILGI